MHTVLRLGHGPACIIVALFVSFAWRRVSLAADQMREEVVRCMVAARARDKIHYLAPYVAQYAGRFIKEARRRARQCAPCLWQIAMRDFPVEFARIVGKIAEEFVISGANPILEPE